MILRDSAPASKGPHDAQYAIDIFSLPQSSSSGESLSACGFVPRCDGIQSNTERTAGGVGLGWAGLGWVYWGWRQISRPRRPSLHHACMRFVYYPNDATSDWQVRGDFL